MSTPRKPRVFISRTAAGLAAVAEKIAVILRDRGIEPIIQTEFYPSTHDVKGMLADHLRSCDAVICLIGPAYGSGPTDPFTKKETPIVGLKDPRTKDRIFSYTQLELLIARDLPRRIYTFFIEKGDLLADFAPQPTDLAERQQKFIADFATDTSNTYGTFTHWQVPEQPTRGLENVIQNIPIELTVLASKPTNIPYTTLGTLFKGRDTFLAELRQHLTAESTGAITGKRTIHGMGGVGKTRAAIEYAWKHAADYNALLFITGDTPDALHRNIAALCGPLVLNLPEQDEKEQSLQVEAALRWLKLHPGWVLIIDNVDTEQAAHETKALLAKLTTGHVLITSRIGDWTGHVKSLDLDVLSDTASIEFLDERTAERRPKRDDDQKNVATLVQLLDCLALALEQAGAHISTSAISYADYIKLWESKRPAALAWHDQEKMKYPRSLAITYETSVAQLRSGAKDLFNILAWFAPDPIPRNLLDARPNPADERYNLSDIERLSLARYLSDGKTFTIHRLIQEITRQQQETLKPQQTEEKPHGIWNWIRSLFLKPPQCPFQPPALITALDWLNKEYPNDSHDVRTWPIAASLTPHAIAAANAGAARDIPKPTGKLLNEAATFLNAKADHRKAESLFRNTLAIFEKTLGKKHPNVASCLNNLASLLQDTNRHAEAEPLMRRAMAIDKASYGDSHPKVGICVNNLATLLKETNRHAEAEPLMRRAMAIAEVSYGNSHPDFARALNNLAHLLQATNRLAEAEPLMRRALAIDEASYGDLHPALGRDLNNLATLLHDTNRLAEAELLIRRALAIDEATYGDSHPMVGIRLNNLAHLLKATNHLAEAEPLMRRALAIDEASFGDSHPNVARDLNNLAALLKETNHHAEAEPLMRRALAIDEASYGDSHPDVALDLNNLAQLLHATNRLAEAEPLMRRSVQILEDSFGASHPNSILARENWERLLNAMKQ